MIALSKIKSLDDLNDEQQLILWIYTEAERSVISYYYYNMILTMMVNAE